MRGLGLDDLINDAIIQRFVRGHEEIAVGIFGNLLHGLIAVVGHVLVETGLGEKDLLGLNFNIGSRTLSTTKRLMDHNTSIGQGLALARSSSSEKEGTHTCRHTEANGLNIARDELHGIVNSKTSRDGSTRRVDVQSDVGLRILVGQEQKLRHKNVGHLIIDISTKKQNAILEQLRNYINLLSSMHHRQWEEAEECEDAGEGACSAPRVAAVFTFISPNRHSKQIHKSTSIIAPNGIQVIIPHNQKKFQVS